MDAPATPRYPAKADNRVERGLAARDQGRGQVKMGVRRRSIVCAACKFWAGDLAISRA